MGTRGYDVKLCDIAEVYHCNEENGAEMIRLTYGNGVLKLEIRCTDDSEPYWAYGGEYKCTLKNWAILLYRIANLGFRKGNGDLYRVRCEWDWFDEEE